MAALAEEVQQVTGFTVQLAYVDQGYTNPHAAQAAQQHGMHLEVVKHPKVVDWFASARAPLPYSLPVSLRTYHPERGRVV